MCIYARMDKILLCFQSKVELDFKLNTTSNQPSHRTEPKLGRKIFGHLLVGVNFFHTLMVVVNVRFAMMPHLVGFFHTLLVCALCDDTTCCQFTSLLVHQSIYALEINDEPYDGRDLATVVLERVGLVATDQGGPVGEKILKLGAR